MRIPYRMSRIPKRTSEPVSETRICVEVINWEVISGKWGQDTGQGEQPLKCVVHVCVCESVIVIVLVWVPPEADSKIRIQVQIVWGDGFF